jgi:hypothetical protein
MEITKSKVNYKLYYLGCLLLFGILLIPNIFFIWWFDYVLAPSIALLFILCIFVIISFFFRSITFHIDNVISDPLIQEISLGIVDIKDSTLWFNDKPDITIDAEPFNILAGNYNVTMLYNYELSIGIVLFSINYDVRKFLNLPY